MLNSARWAFLLAPLFVALLSAPTHACNLPVCDIPAAITKLEADGPAYRFQFISGLRVKYRRSENPLELENLRQFSIESRALSIRLNDEDWLVRESEMLLDQSLLGLIKFRRPILAALIVPDFKTLSTEGGRYEAIKYWAENVAAIEEVDTLRELISYGEQARDHSLSLGDAEWIPREGERLMTLASAVLATLDPYHEGIFQISIECPETNVNCKQNYPDLSILTLLEAGQRSGYGLVSSFIMPSPVEPAFLFPDSQFTGGTGRIYGYSKVSTPTFPRPSEFKLQVERETGLIKGVIIDSRSNGFVRFKGKPIRRVKELVDKTAGSAVNVVKGDLPGIYAATIGHRKGKMVLKETGDQNLIASFLPEQDGDPMDFKIGTFVKSQGILNLVAFGTKMDFIKTILRFEKKDGVIIASGFHFNSADATSEDWSLTRTGSIANPDIEAAAPRSLIQRF